MQYLSEAMRLENRLTAQQLIREDNLKRLFALLRETPSLSRVDLARRAHLSPTTVSALVDDLVNAGFVSETGCLHSSATGRRPIGLRLEPRARLLPVFSLNRWGVRYSLLDLGCETIETMFVSHASDRYAALPRDQAAKQAGEDYAALFEDILKNRSQLYDPSRACAVLISFPGMYLEDEELYSMSAMGTAISRESLLKLEQRLGVAVFLGNSAVSMAYAEKTHLNDAGVDVSDLIYIYVCEGVGAGIIVGGEIFLGANGHAGEIGHVTVDYRGKPCFCGGRGCLEQYVNLDAVLARVKQAAAESSCTRLLDMAEDSCDNITLEMVGRAFEMGIPPVREALTEVARMLFAGIYGAACITGVRNIVLGGGIERLGDGFLDALRDQCVGQGEVIPAMRFSYATTGFRGDSLGIARYFVDKAICLVACAQP